MYRDTCMPWIEDEPTNTTSCASCGVDTGSNDMLCDDCDAYADEEEAEQMAEELYYDRPDVIAGEVFQDRLDMYRNEH